MADLFRDTVVALDKQKRFGEQKARRLGRGFDFFLVLSIPDSRGTAGGRSTVLSKLASRGW